MAQADASRLFSVPAACAFVGNAAQARGPTGDENGTRLAVKPLETFRGRQRSRLDQPDRAPIKVWSRHECFNGKLADLPWQARKGLQEFDYGYALTVHKAQGSAWDSVLLLDQSATFKTDQRRWLYTGITRASQSIVVAV